MGWGPPEGDHKIPRVTGPLPQTSLLGGKEALLGCPAPHQNWVACFQQLVLGLPDLS